MNPPIRPRSRGFTLIEIMVALLILGIMAALGYGTYRAARLSAERTEESLQRSREIEFGMRMLLQDLAQTVPRPVRDILGSENRLPALKGTGGFGTLTIPATTGSGAPLGSNSTMSFASQSFNSSPSTFGGANTNMAALIDLTRGGWSNTAGQQRSTLQRVSYGMVGDVIKRSYQMNLDTVQGNKPVVQDLLSGVKAIQLRYLDANQAWQPQWPPPAMAPTDAVTSRPLAVELIIEFKDWGRIRRVVEVAG